jgi:hypothetical protein
VIHASLGPFHNRTAAVDFVIQLTEWGDMRMDLHPALSDIGRWDLGIYWKEGVGAWVGFARRGNGRLP